MAVLAALAILLIAPPASAKGIDVQEVTVAGPGLERPITLSASEFNVSANRRYPAQEYVWQVLNPFRPLRELQPPTQLGTKYEIVYRLESPRPVGDSNATYEDRVFQALYPFADGGPIAVTPPRQTWHVPFTRAVRKIPAGALEFPAPVLEVLREHGLPSQPPPPEVPDEIRATDRPLAPWFKLAVVLVVFAIAAAIIRRRTPSQS